MILPEENLLNTTVFTPRNDTVTQFNEGNGFNKGVLDRGRLEEQFKNLFQEQRCSDFFEKLKF